MVVALIVLAAALTFFGTMWVIRHAEKHTILDVPNERSSHTVPTPRGGGLAIVLVVLGGIAAGHYLGIVPANIAISLIGGGVAIAAVGWVDDRFDLPPVVKVAVHVLAAVWAVSWLGGLRTVSLPNYTLYLGNAGSVLAIVGITWITNLYNFMDGIDGIAGVEGVSVGGWAGVLLILGGRTELAFVAFLIAAASLGFLIWNWTPARIFMGDVGSGFLGFVLGCLAVAGENAKPSSLLWLGVLLGVFVVDATITLIRRAAHGERIYSAHRRHAYQRICRAGFSHGRASATVLGINMVLGCLVVAGVTHPRLAHLAIGAAAVILFGSYAAVERTKPMFDPESETQI